MSGATERTVNWLQSIVSDSANLTTDSRQVKPGDVFLAYAGARVDARQLIGDAIANGASAIIWDPLPDFAWNRQWTTPHRAEPNLKSSCGLIASHWYGRPSENLWSVGVTGTSGKSSTTLWIAQAFNSLGRRCAVAGTLGVGFIGNLEDTGLTTPDPVVLQQMLRDLVDGGAKALAMEVSSIGLVEGRVTGTKFDIALFTNLTRDHLDYHGSMEKYQAAKTLLFAMPGLRAAVINQDDAAGRAMAATAEASGAKVTTYSANGDETVDLYAKEISVTPQGMRFKVCGAFGEREIETPLIGAFNVSNLLGVLGVLLASDVEPERALDALCSVSPAPGRLERIVAEQGPLVLIDYAHKPDALEQALTACRPLAQARGGKLWVVFGCGGDRDTGKRPIMGEIAARRADWVIVTSDNPRTEQPRAIVDAIMAGVPASVTHVAALLDRRAAIQNAVRQSDVNDVVLIAGKGHERYQEIAGTRHAFSDATEVLAALRMRQEED